MGRRKYLNMLALGRSPYDVPEPVSDILSPSWRPLSTRAAETNAPVQEYDSRGHPINARAKNREKELRRAKNDILSTMGIVVSSRNVDADTSNIWRKNKALLVSENESGLYVTIASDILSTVSGWWLHAFDQRLQISDAYDRTPLLDMLHRDYRSMGAWRFYFGGLPTWLMYRTLKATYVCISDNVFPKIGQIHYSSMQNRKWAKCFQYLTSGLLLGAHVFANICLQKYLAVALLQTLNIIPTNTLPSLRSTLPFSGQSIIQAFSSFSRPDLKSLFSDIVTCPLVTGYILGFVQPFLKAQIHYMLMNSLPKPDHPDRLSIEVAKENDLTELRIDRPGNGDSPMAIARMRIVSFGEGLKGWMTAIGEICIQRPLMGLSRIVGGSQEDAQASPAETDEMHTIRLGNPGSEILPLESSEDHVNSINENVTQVHDVRFPLTASGSRFSEALQVPQDLSTLVNGTPALQDTLNDTHSQLINRPTAEEVGLNTEEVSVIPHDNRPTSAAVSPSGSQTGEGATFATYTDTAVVSHRVSLLSVGPADFMSSLLSSAIAAILVRPLNSYWIRSTAESYNRSPAGRDALPGATTDLQISDRQLRPLTAWCGGNNSDDRLSYASKVVMISGVQLLSDIIIWKLGTAFTVFLGSRKFTWGSI